MNVPLSKAEDVHIVGNKAQSLYLLIKLGLPVPSGFVVPYDIQDEGKIKAAVEKYCKADKLYAIRSSSNLEDSKEYTYAGLFETHLGVSKSEVLQKVKDIQNVTKNKRLKEFCKISKKKSSDIKISVLVQEMLHADVSGICFTINPVTKNKSEIVIEAALGLGEFVVQNEVKPDFYCIKKNREIKEKKIFAQHKKLMLNKSLKEVPIFNYGQKLSDEHILQLVEYALKIEEFMGFPCDIEWAVEKNKLYILQSRPVIL